MSYERRPAPLPNGEHKDMFRQFETKTLPEGDEGHLSPTMSEKAQHFRRCAKK
jgi:hypothetical protein